MTDPQSFGAWLQRERERRDMTLRAIADRTKIGTTILQSLERGDVSRWPGGIYRRSFIRSYAEAVGLDAELVLANFERLFPEPESLSALDKADAAVLAPRVSADAAVMRLQLASPGRPSTVAMRTAGMDLAAALGLGTAAFFAMGWVGFWCAMAMTMLAFHVCTVLGWRRVMTVPVATAIAQWRSRRAEARAMVAELADLPDAQPDPALDLNYYAH